MSTIFSDYASKFENSAKDIKFCSSCIHYGSYQSGYLCNYFLDTGKRRNCKPGVGCTQHVARTASVSKNIKEIICDRCGTVFIGTRNAHLCPKCRKIRTTKVESEDSE